MKCSSDLDSSPGFCMLTEQHAEQQRAEIALDVHQVKEFVRAEREHEAGQDQQFTVAAHVQDFAEQRPGDE